MDSQLNVLPAMSILLLLFASAATGVSGTRPDKDDAKPDKVVSKPGRGVVRPGRGGVRPIRGPSGVVFDVVAKFGAKADKKSDLSKPLTDAWKAACASTTPSTVVIPKGSFYLSEACLEGPCKAPIEVLLHGNVKAPTSPQAHKEPKWVSFRQVENFRLSGRGVFDGQGTQAYKRDSCGMKGYCPSLPINIRFDFLTNALIEDIMTKDSKQFHMNVLGCKNITFDRVRVTAPADSPNTDGIHIGRSDGVHIFNMRIKTGDDCISIGDGSKNLDIQGITCGPGHGISIGSLGKFEKEDPVEGVHVKKCTITNTTNGVRIKTYPGAHACSASDINFEDITMKNVMCPILVDQRYCPHNKCNYNEDSKVKLAKLSFKNIRGTSGLPEALRIICSGKFPCENVEVSNIKLTHKGTKAISYCLNVKPKVSGKNNPVPCSSPCPKGPIPTV